MIANPSSGENVPAPTPPEPACSTAVAVKAFVAAINAQDLAALSALMTDDHTFIDSMDQKTSGREAMLAAWPRYFAMFPDYRIRVDRVVTEAGVGIMLGSWSATFAGPRGTAADNAVGGPAAWSAIVSEGKIKVWQVYADHTRTYEVVRRSQQ